MLITINMMTEEKAIAIVQKYPTVMSLVNAYKYC